MKKKIDFVAWSVVEGQEKDTARWRECGVCFKNQKEGLTVLLDTVPLSGKLVLLPPREREGKTAQQPVGRKLFRG